MMRALHRLTRFAVTATGAALFASANVALAQAPSLQYPSTRRGDQVDEYHGTRVADPYRWLEDVTSPDTRGWIEVQNALTRSYLDAIPERPRIRAALTQLWDYPKYGVPVRRGPRLFYFENSGLQNQPVYYVRDRDEEDERVLLDPNTLSTDGTVAISTIAPSPDGSLLGYGVSVSGSDWQEFRVREVRSGRDLADTLRWIKFSNIAWTRDNRGFFYSRFDAPTEAEQRAGTTRAAANRGHKVYYHRLGEPQSNDRLILERPDNPDWLFRAEVSDDGQYAVITVSQGSDERTRLYFVDMSRARRPTVGNPVVRLLDEFDASYDFVHSEGMVFYVRTNHQAPNGRLVAIDINARRPSAWRTVVPNGPDALVGADVIARRIVATYLADTRSSVRLFSLRGQPLGEVPLPGIGAVAGITGERADRDFFYSFTSFLQPPTIYQFDVERRTNLLYRQPTVAFDASRYETRQVFVTSRDGTRVPMFVTARRGLPRDGRNPTLMHAYGGFNISMTPAFSPTTLAWLDMGGVYAVPNLRGGGEYGRAWHEAGMLGRKQNVFDDFIAAAEYLVREGYTSPSRLAISGGSNGGLLVGAAMTQRPDLFAVALPAVGVMDMLRYHKFTIGWAWASEFGSADDPAAFKYLMAYSPLHNIKPGTCYPATLVTAADHDDRVVPGHSFKFAATLQAAQSCDRPALIRIDTKAGHGAGKPTSKQIEEATDRLAFAVRNLNVEVSPA
ncbi:MAG: prolyl oligopeptidase family serine peptidase, partial [Gemmatimonadota bacterium]|nr:prolyl oligopeptidase family serine peptidase [Gemmatimonadota bacterium]